jgi:hypothetical protein
VKAWLIALIVLIPVITIGIVIAFAGGIAPQAHLRAESSADPGCRAALLTGLGELQRKLGLPLEFTATDADTLASSGALESTYARDAVQHTASFGLDADDTGTCSLRMWLKREQSPGSTRSTSGSFGSAYLPACRCE